MCVCVPAALLGIDTVRVVKSQTSFEKQGRSSCAPDKVEERFGLSAREDQRDTPPVVDHTS
jgi:hypothetical protein